MESELAAVVLGALIAGGVSLATFMLAARSERKRASAEQRRFEATRADQLRATLVDERRKLLDSSSLLFVKLDETTSLVFGQDGQSQSNPHWDELRREFANFSARLRMWFGVGPEGDAVVTAFDAVMRTTVDVYSSPTVGRIQANRTLLEASRLAPPADLTALDRLKEETDTLQSQLLDDARVARKQYYSIAHSYLAGDPGALGLPAGASPRLD